MSKFHITSKLLIFAGSISAVLTLASPFLMAVGNSDENISTIAFAFLPAAVDGIFRLGVCLGMVSIIEYLRKLTEESQLDESQLDE